MDPFKQSKEAVEILRTVIEYAESNRPIDAEHQARLMKLQQFFGLTGTKWIMDTLLEKREPCLTCGKVAPESERIDKHCLDCADECERFAP